MSRGPARLFVSLVSFALALGISLRARVASAADPPAKAKAPETSPYVPYPPLSPRVIPQPDNSYTIREVRPYMSFAWLLLQVIPSPELVVGRVKEAEGTETKASFGIRWQATPVLWSWGTNRRVSRWRYFVVDPLARHSGSLELSGNVEYVFGHVDRAIIRPTVRAYFPLVQRGEYLSVSIGTSGYVYDDKVRSAYEVGAYMLYGLFGLQVTVAPDNGPMTFTSTLRIRYF